MHQGQTPGPCCPSPVSAGPSRQRALSKRQAWMEKQGTSNTRHSPVTGQCRGLRVNHPGPVTPPAWSRRLPRGCGLSSWLAREGHAGGSGATPYQMGNILDRVGRADSLQGLHCRGCAREVPRVTHAPGTWGHTRVPASQP